jgi:hypothetical protein
MLRALALGSALLAAAAWAEGPGSRIRTTPEVPQPMGLGPAPSIDEAKACERWSGERRDRCLERLRETAPDRRPSGPEATGMGSGAGAGATSGTTGGASFGGSAPR